MLYRQEFVEINTLRRIKNFDTNDLVILAHIEHDILSEASVDNRLLPIVKANVEKSATVLQNLLPAQ